MTIVNQPGVRVVLVAHANRELPDEVQQWLRTANNSAYASPDIYDTLALLAQGKKPAAIIIGMDAVDWNELDFFDLSRRLSPETHIYLIQTKHQQEKTEAACARGAICFDPDQFNEDMSRTITAPRDYGMGGLLAGSLRTTSPAHKPAATTEPLTHAGQTHVPAKAYENESAQQAVVPVVRLVTLKDHDQETNKTIPFPWAPGPNRPQRTPPAPSATPVAKEINTRPAEKRKTINVQLTSEELAALMSKPLNPENDSDMEQSQ